MIPSRIFTTALVFIFMITGIGLARAELIRFFRDYPQLDLKSWYVSDGWSNGDHQSCEWRAHAVDLAGGKLRLTLSDRGGKVRPIGCGEIHTNKRYGYGRYEARLRSAAGSGLNTAFFTYVGPPVGVPEHDEIDFEFIGKQPDTVDITVWTKGKSSGAAVRVPLGFDASKDFHDYALEWTPTAVRWYADGKLIHETPEGAPIPRNPGGIYFSLWSGSKIEDDWMGPFTYTEPVTAQVEWVRFTPMQ
jgi:endo-1,3-1,4-beta-glycanase ExoK